jgi:hypothetical protein
MIFDGPQSSGMGEDKLRESIRERLTDEGMVGDKRPRLWSFDPFAEDDENGESSNDLGREISNSTRRKSIDRPGKAEIGMEEEIRILND